MPRKRFPRSQHFALDQASLFDLKTIQAYLRGTNKTAAVKWAIMRAAEMAAGLLRERDTAADTPPPVAETVDA